MVQQLSTNTFTTAKWIVSPTASDGTHTTIGSALTSASSGDTIFIRPGTYTENLTLKVGVNLSAFDCDSSLNATGHVIISGNCTLSTAGSVTISGIQLQTNSAACITVSGSVASILNLNNCFIYSLNSTGIVYSSSSASSSVMVSNCYGDIGTTGIGMWTVTSAGLFAVLYSRLSNNGSSTTASTSAGGVTNLNNSLVGFPVSWSSSTIGTFNNTRMDTATVNATCFTTSGTAAATIVNCNFASGTASAISIGAGTTVNVYSCSVSSSNTNAVTGAGTINYAGISYLSSKINNVTTQSGGTLTGSANTTPSAGFLGETISSTIDSASAITLSNNTAADITSIALTAGVWDVSCLGRFSGTITGTAFSISISATSATRGTVGADNQSPTAPTAASGTTHSVPSFRVLLTTNATYYLVGFALFSVGTLKGFGRISATRVG